MKFETISVHGGEENFHFGGAVCVPVFQSSNFLTDNQSDYHDVKYIRLNNTPNHLVLHEKLAAMEEGEAGLVMASGMGAISTALLTVLKPGDHMLVQDCIYGGSYTFIQKDLKDFNISATWIDVEKPETWKAALKPNTKVIFVESIANPLTNVGELDLIAKFARENNLISMIDNTIATPYFFKPLKLGFDLSLHSATKYLNGHSDIVAGAVVGSKLLVKKIKTRLDHMGATMDPHACFLLNRGIKTMALRMEQHQKNALAVARFLEHHPRVKKVYYPGLETHPNFKTARRLFTGNSGLFSFQIDGEVQDADNFLKKVRIPLSAASLGGVETLVTRPATTSHLGLTPAERAQMGITESVIRISMGIENTDDLIEDFRQALQ